MTHFINKILRFWPFFLFSAGLCILIPVFSNMQEPFNRWMMKRHQKASLDSPVRIVYFDGEDIKSLGGWPLSRNIYGFLISQLSRYEVSRIGFHVFWGKENVRDENDLFLASVLKSSPVVTGSYYFQQLNAYSENEKTVPFLARPGSIAETYSKASGLEAPDSLYFLPGVEYGFVNLPLDASGMVEEAPLLIRCGRSLYPSLGLVLAEEEPGTIRVPRRGSVKINYTVNTEHLPMIPVHELLDPADPSGLKNELKGKVIIVGIVSSQLGFERPTPLDPAMPVIGIHAQILDNLMNGSYLRWPPFWMMMIPVLIAGAVTFFANFRQVRYKWICYALLAAFFLISAEWLWTAHILFPLSAGMAALITGAAITGIRQFAQRQREWREEEKKRLALEMRFSEKVQSLVRLERDYRQLREKYQAEIDGLRTALTDVPEKSQSQLKLQYPDILCAEGSPMMKILAEIERIGQTDESVLITGESGTGKELIAKAIHEHSPRSNEPFVAVNCGAITESLLESELFGHEKGAFTGAHKTKAGFFEAAGSGTILLDEVTETTPAFQAKLLRILQEGTCFRVGSTQVFKTKCRIIAATNQDVQKRIENGSFRQDLYFRLNVLPLRVPPLRERPQDIPVLLNHFLKNKKLQMTEGAQQLLARHTWPGNVRELQNLAARLRLLSDDSHVFSEWLANQLGAPAASEDTRGSMDERILILYREYQFSNDANRRIAETLGGVHRSTVTEYLKGMAFQFYHESQYQIEGVVSRFNPESNPKLDDRIRRRILTYLNNLKEKIDPAHNAESNLLNLQEQLRKLPNRYHDAFRAVIMAFLQGEWK